MEAIDELRAVKLLEGLSDSELGRLARQLREVTHPAGSRVAVRGRDGAGFMVILDGEAEVETVDGRRRTLTRGDHFGEMALLDHEGRSADVIARTDLRLAGVPEWGFKPLLAEHPEVAYRLLQTLSRRLREVEAG
ncbi:MAG: cyclic nucleotide-binding domain-containing protein [Candidatus Dormibacteraeota bacterium]|nr:cyclic nucleotide-binding domain-containing protein [Candidatus Dormibacteraeota bacterium]